MNETYYNEFDPYAAQWLRNLQAEGQIPAGTVDERSIVDVQPEEVGETSHFFAGIGGWPYALRLAGWPEDRPVWTGSCPCQPFSCAGKSGGVGDERHLWPAFRGLIAKCRPAIILGEQVASADGRKWLAGVRVDLERMGYAVGCADLPAACVSSPHKRQRFFWVAESELQRARTGVAGFQGEAGIGRNRPTNSGETGGMVLASEPRLEGHARYGDDRRQSGRIDSESSRSASATGFWSEFDIAWCRDPGGGPDIARRIEPGTFPLAHGIPDRVGKLRAYGNAIVPQVAALFIRAFMESNP